MWPSLLLIYETIFVLITLNKMQKISNSRLLYLELLVMSWQFLVPLSTHFVCCLNKIRIATNNSFKVHYFMQLYNLFTFSYDGSYYINDATNQHTLTWLSINKPNHTNKLYILYILAYSCTLLIHYIVISYDMRLEIGNINDGNISCISCLFPLIPWYSMEKCINLNVKFLTSVTFCDGDGIRMRYIRWHGIWAEDKNNQPTELNWNK